jgi:ankyrin repeat protein
MTPLHLAAEEGNTDVTKFLVEAKASLSAVDNKVHKSF